MQFKLNSLSSVVKAALCAVVALGFVSQTHAEETKVDGKWTWTVQGRGGGGGGAERKMTLTLKTVDGKLTGKLASPGRNDQVRETEIKDAKLKGDELTFKVVREANGNTFTTTYKGKVADNKIKGKMESERNGQTRSRDWEAKRVMEKE